MYIKIFIFGKEKTATGDSIIPAIEYEILGTPLTF